MARKHFLFWDGGPDGLCIIIMFLYYSNVSRYNCYICAYTFFSRIKGHIIRVQMQWLPLDKNRLYCGKQTEYMHHYISHKTHSKEIHPGAPSSRANGFKWLSVVRVSRNSSEGFDKVAYGSSCESQPFSFFMLAHPSIRSAIVIWLSTGHVQLKQQHGFLMYIFLFV